ncbi:MAG: DUF2520 domain-containing protein [Cytophagaceae bacterium]|jgi:predicted short-subunit dehydrogenase-like oxidoreductase (DUF2520 family)|nr:DUF2520 domain-containing protein [Cytophagaceae bacterium]
MKITLIGSGNVAAHLGLAFRNAGIEIRQVYSRRLPNAQHLAAMVEAEPVTDLTLIDTSADFYFIAVADSAIPAVAESMPAVSGVVAHTAGCVSIEALKRFVSFGSFYPFQTFTKERKIDFEKIHLLIEGNNYLTEQKLFAVASQLTPFAETANAEKRTTLHLAAAFGCNFVNHLYAIAQKILDEAGLSFDCIKPLIEETASKATAIDPVLAQTGPARRGDTGVMQYHLNKLAGKTDLQNIYKLLSDSICSFEQAAV